MTTISRNLGQQGQAVEAVPPSESGLSLDQYVRDSSQKVDEITRQFQAGKPLDFESRDWMLDQVNFIVEAIGDESLKLDEALRSNLLQLLMALVNLNEHIRQQAAPDLSPL